MGLGRLSSSLNYRLRAVSLAVGIHVVLFAVGQGEIWFADAYSYNEMNIAVLARKICRLNRLT